MRKRTLVAAAVALGLGGTAPGASLAVTLEEAIEETLSTHPEVLAARKEREARVHEIEQAKGGYYPTVQVTAGIGREWSDNPTTRAAGEDGVTLTRQETGVNLRQMLFDGFGTSSEVDRQRARYESAAFTAKGVANNTALRTAEVYLEVLHRQRLLELAEENLEAHRRVYDQIKLRADRGVGRESDLAQIEGRVARAESNVIADRVNLQDAVSNYIAVVGAEPEDAVMPDDPREVMPADLGSALTRAEKGHPTLKSANADVEATIAQHRAAKHAFYPRLDLELSRTWNDDWDGVEGYNNDAQVMLRLQYDLINGGRDLARRKQTAILINEAKEVRNKSRRQVEESTRLSWSAYRAADDQLRYLKRHADSAGKTRDAYAKQFQIGQRTLLDLLDSENEYFEARRAYMSAQIDRLFAEYRVLASMGTLVAHVTGE